MLDDYLEPDAFYLLDELEVSLSPANQMALAERLNKMAWFSGCQFIISTHSSFMLGTLNAKIYNLDSEEMEEAQRRVQVIPKKKKNGRKAGEQIRIARVYLKITFCQTRSSFSNLLFLSS